MGTVISVRDARTAGSGSTTTTPVVAAAAVVAATTWEGAHEVAGLDEQLAGLRGVGSVLAYRNAIERAAPGKVVVDLAGGGVLAVVAAKAGARKVYAITPASVVPVV